MDGDRFFTEPSTVAAPAASSQRGIFVPLEGVAGGNNPAQAFIPELEVLLRLPVHGFNHVDPFDRALQAKLVNAAKEFKVSLEFDHAKLDFVTLRGWMKADIRNAVKAVHFLLSGPTSGTDYCHPCYMVETRVDKENERTVTLERLPKGGHRAVLQSQVRSTSDTENDIAAIRRDLADRLAQDFQKLASYLRRTPEALRMRVHFGRAQFKQLRDDSFTQKLADFAKFTKQVARRGTGDFEKNFGSAEFAGQLRGRILLDQSHRFQPGSTQGAALGAHTASYTLILLMKGLRVEVPVNRIEQMPVRGPASQLRRRRPAPGLIDSQVVTIEYNFGSYRAFRLETRLRSCEIITCCPEKNQDWQLEVLKEVDFSEIPFTVEELRNAISFRVDCSSSDQAPIPLLNPRASPNKIYGKIDETLMKGSWEFDMKDAPNIAVDVSQYRHWSGTNTNAPPSVGSGVYLYSKAWAFELKRSSAMEPRNWRDDCSNLFDVRKTGPDAYLSIVEQIGTVHDVVEAVSRASSAAREAGGA